jgi:beta-xylosidase
MVRRIVVGLCRRLILYDWYHIMEQDGKEDSCGKHFQVPTRLTTVTRQTGEYKVDLTRHPKFPLAFGELASGRFPHCSHTEHDS